VKAFTVVGSYAPTSRQGTNFAKLMLARRELFPYIDAKLTPRPFYVEKLPSGDDLTPKSQIHFEDRQLEVWQNNVARGGSGLYFSGLSQAWDEAFGLGLFGAFKIQNRA
jgi:hypothetical protein